MSTPIDRDRDDARRRADEQAADHVHDESVSTGHRSPDPDAGRGSDEPTAVYTPPPVDDRTTSGRADDTYADQRRTDDTYVDQRRADARGVTDDTTVVEPAPVASASVAREEVVAREKEEFGGMKFGSAFFGWLTAMGMTVLLTALVAGAAAALEASPWHWPPRAAA